jgi:hypothetical protein
MPTSKELTQGPKRRDTVKKMPMNTTPAEYAQRRENHEVRLQWFGSRVASELKRYEEKEDTTGHPAVWVENAISFLNTLKDIAREAHIAPYPWEERKK